MKFLPISVHVLTMIALGSANLAAQDIAQTSTIITTRHQTTVSGKTIRYTARAGTLPIRDNNTGEVHGYMFFVAYSVDGRTGQAPRPLTFLWNGGPGSNAGLVHLLGFGPKRVALRDSSSSARPIIIDNDGTWLDHTDLVFVDPIGTGYSRPTSAEYAAEFYQSRGDAESVAEFIRVFRTRFDRLDAPLFIMGESYGVTRAALVADALERRNTRLAGVIMLGLALPLGETPAPVRVALGLPTFTAAAFANKKLPPDLQGDLATALRAAEQWALDVYAPAYARRDSLNDSQRDVIVKGLSRFTGLAESGINRQTLRVTMEQHSNALLASSQLVVGRYDSRMTAPAVRTEGPYDPTKDPSLKDILDATTVLRYLRNTLGYQSDLFYQGPFGGGYPAPTAFRGDWMSVRWNRAEPPNPAALRTAMTTNPALEVIIACGYFDMVCDYFGNEYAVRQLPAEFANRVKAYSYGGGHATYTDAAARLAFKRDVAAFITRLAASPQVRR